jgi:hypothetical protein
MDTLTRTPSPRKIGILLALKAGQQIALSLKRLLEANQTIGHPNEEDRHYCRTGADSPRKIGTIAVLALMALALAAVLALT